MEITNEFFKSFLSESEKIMLEIKSNKMGALDKIDILGNEFKLSKNGGVFILSRGNLELRSEYSVSLFFWESKSYAKIFDKKSNIVYSEYLHKILSNLINIPIEVKKEICVKWWAELCQNRFEGMSFESLTIDTLRFEHEIYSEKEGNRQEIRLYVKEGGRFECDFTCILQDRKWHDVIIENSDNVQVIEILFNEIIRIDNV